MMDVEPSGQSHHQVSQLARTWQRSFHFWTLNFFAISALALVFTIKPLVVAAAFVTGRPFSIDACPGVDQSEACIEARASAAFWIGIAAFSNAILGMLCGPICGAFGDMYGRRSLLVGTMLLFLFCYGFLFLSTFTPGFVWLFLLSDSLLGVCPYIAVIFAVLADERLPSERPAAFGLFQAVLGGGVVVGPFVSMSVTIRSGCIVAVVASLAAVFLAFCYPETSPGVRSTPSLIEVETYAPPSRRRSWLGAGPRELVQTDRRRETVLQPFAVLRLLCSSVLLRRLSLCVLVTTTIAAMPQSFAIIFFQDQVHASRQLATWYIIVIGISSLVAGVVVLRPTVKAIGLRQTLLLGLICQFFQMGLLTMSSLVSSVTTSKVLILVACVIGGLATMNFPMIAAMKSNAVSAELQGRIQGAIGSLQYSALSLGPLIGGPLLSFFSKAHPSLGLTQPFYAAPFALSLLLSPAAIVAAYSLPRSAESVRETSEHRTPEPKVDEPLQQDLSRVRERTT